MAVIIMWSTMLVALLMASSNAHAGCTCQCVNGRVTPICSNALEAPPICSPQICPITPPSIAPMNPLRVPPIGTSNCTMKQVYNNYTGQYEWKQICE